MAGRRPFVAEQIAKGFLAGYHAVVRIFGRQGTGEVFVGGVIVSQAGVIGRDDGVARGVERDPGVVVEDVVRARRRAAIVSADGSVGPRYHWQGVRARSVYKRKDNGARGRDYFAVLADGDVLETVQCCAWREAPRRSRIDVWLQFQKVAGFAAFGGEGFGGFVEGCVEGNVAEYGTVCGGALFDDFLTLRIAAVLSHVDSCWGLAVGTIVS